MSQTFFGSASKNVFRLLLNIAIGIFYQAVAGEETDGVVVGDQKVCGSHTPTKIGGKVNLKQNKKQATAEETTKLKAIFLTLF